MSFEIRSQAQTSALGLANVIAIMDAVLHAGPVGHGMLAWRAHVVPRQHFLNHRALTHQIGGLGVSLQLGVIQQLGISNVGDRPQLDIDPLNCRRKRRKTRIPDLTVGGRFGGMNTGHRDRQIEHDQRQNRFVHRGIFQWGLCVAIEPWVA